jgi:hypothetical protein
MKPATSIGVDARVTLLDPRGNSKAIATEQRVPVIAFPSVASIGDR